MSSDTAPADLNNQNGSAATAEPATTATKTIMNGQAKAAQATSEANIAATDPNKGDVLPPTSSESMTAIADANIDIKAADTAEGAISGVTVTAPGTGSTPVSSKKGKDTKRRSSGIPEHKSKKGSKKREIVYNLDCAPGDYYFARMKGHPEWPAIICDEEMLPEVIMGSRPVTAKGANGEYRHDFADGAKNMKERTFPVMFLGTNEFAWMPNIDLRKITEENIKDPENQKSMKKGLLEAYHIAQKFQELDHFKQILFSFETARAEEEKNYAEKLAKDEEKAAKKAERAEKADGKEKKKRKSTATVDGDGMDVDEDGEGAAPKSAKKRKATDTGENEKPAKTPKSIKLSTSKPNGDSAKAKKAKTPKAKAPKEEPQMSEQDRLDKKEKSVLYLRHKLQKGFLQTTAPQESEMDAMGQHFDTLYQYKELEVSIIRKTKIHKVLKAILKLDSVPLDDKFHFKNRSNELLQHWNKILSEEAGSTPNGAGDDDKHDGAAEAGKSEEPSAKPEEPQTEKQKTQEKSVVLTTAEPVAAPVETALPINDAKDETADGDLSMAQSKTEQPSAPATAASTNDTNGEKTALAAGTTTA